MTWCPKVWDALIERFNPTTLIDVGCGEGHSLDYFKSKGVVAYGIDGIDQGRPDIIVHDYTQGPLALGHWDMAWCCEFVEHVAEPYVDNFMVTFNNVTTVALTHAIPGQAGHNHVNCQYSDYWVDQFKTWGFTLDEKFSHFTRTLDSGWWSKTGMVFVKK